MTLLLAKKGPPTGGLKLVSRFEAHSSLVKAFRINKQFERASSVVSLLPLFITACFLCLAGIVSQAQVIVGGLPYYNVSQIEGDPNAGLFASTISVYTLGGLGGGYVSTPAGEFLVSFSGARPDNYPASFIGYCMDLAHYSQTSYQATPISLAHPPTTIPAADYSPNFASADARFQVAYIYDSFVNYAHDNSNKDANIRAAGLQVAIWETLYKTASFDPVPDGADGTTQHSVHAQAMAYINQAATANWGREVNGQYQYDAIWWKGSSPPNSAEAQGLIGPVPEPAEIGLAALACLAVVATHELRQRRMRLADSSNRS